MVEGGDDIIREVTVLRGIGVEVAGGTMMVVCVVVGNLVVRGPVTVLGSVVGAVVVLLDLVTYI